MHFLLLMEDSNKKHREKLLLGKTVLEFGQAASWKSLLEDSLPTPQLPCKVRLTGRQEQIT